MFILYHPPNSCAERLYIYELFLQRFLGFSFQMVEEERNDLRITLKGGGDKEIVVNDIFFKKYETNWLLKESLPKTPLEKCDIFAEIGGDFPATPVIYGEQVTNNNFIKRERKLIKVGIDLFGSSFYMLTRYEELVIKTRDKHNRFPAYASLAYKEGFLHRPIVNEYLEILWTLIKIQWPELVRKERSSKVFLSHDVDWPLTVSKNLHKTMKSMTGDIIKRKNYLLAKDRLTSYFNLHLGKTTNDVFNTFHYLMSKSESRGFKSAFYFITDRTAGDVDGNYSIQSNWIKSLLREIHNRNHEIGLHPSYLTYQNGKQLSFELKRLKKVCENENIPIDEIGGRQHFLRWDPEVTWKLWNEAGLHYDSTLSYAETPGFRCGICYEFPVFNIVTKEKLSLIERPLLVMEVSLLNKEYLSLSHNDAMEKILNIYDECTKYNGDFTMLWHNSQLAHHNERMLYDDIIQAL
ncbi:polysaccharide deacetylase family protein [Alkalihalobacillus sp. R86527]|uniref:polysaccharide deacetylase family protein n=1 Tax=Alkalihalobacillus sp. R86527 TaxID=3093863 RepID=UPI00367201CB